MEQFKLWHVLVLIGGVTFVVVSLMGGPLTQDQFDGFVQDDHVRPVAGLNPFACTWDEVRIKHNGSVWCIDAEAFTELVMQEAGLDK